MLLAPMIYREGEPWRPEATPGLSLSPVCLGRSEASVWAIDRSTARAQGPGVDCGDACVRPTAKRYKERPRDYKSHRDAATATDALASRARAQARRRLVYPGGCGSAPVSSLACCLYYASEVLYNRRPGHWSMPSLSCWSAAISASTVSTDCAFPGLERLITHSA